MKIFHGENKGFTLIELIVVIAVLGILSAIAIPRISSMSDKAKDANIAQVAGSIRTAMEVYYQENKKYPEEEKIEDWKDLRAVVDVIKIKDMSSYYILSFKYTRSDLDSYKMELESSSTGDIYFIERSDFYKKN